MAAAKAKVARTTPSSPRVAKKYTISEKDRGWHFLRSDGLEGPRTTYGKATGYYVLRVFTRSGGVRQYPGTE